MTGTRVRVVRRADDRRVLDVLADELGVSADEVVLVREHGKPRVAEPETDLRFSVSRTPGLVVVALARGVEVGVDVESTARDVTGWALWEQLLSAEEIARLPDERSARNRALLHAWVAREAILKAAGAGLDLDPALVEVQADGTVTALPEPLGDPRTWSLEWLRLDDAVAAIACAPAAEPAQEPSRDATESDDGTGGRISVHVHCVESLSSRKRMSFVPCRKRFDCTLS